MPPRALLAVAARVVPLIARLTVEDAPIPSDARSTIGGHHRLYDSSKARTELGDSPRSAGQTLRDTLLWHAFMGWLPTKVAGRLGDEVLVPNPEWAKPLPAR